MKRCLKKSPIVRSSLSYYNLACGDGMPNPGSGGAGLFLGSIPITNRDV